MRKGNKLANVPNRMVIMPGLPGNNLAARMVKLKPINHYRKTNGNYK